MLQEYYSASFSDAYYENGCIWFSNHMFNGLFSYNLQTKSINLVGNFPCTESEKKLMHKKVFRYGEKLFFFPNQEVIGVHAYSLSNHKIELLDKGISDDSDEKTMVADIVIHKEKAMIFLKEFTQGIYEFDFVSESFARKKDFFRKILEQKLINDSNSLLRLFYSDGVIWIPVYGTHSIIKYDIEEDFFERITLLENIQIADLYVKDQLLIVTQVNKSEVLIFNNNEVIRYEVEAQEICERIKPEKGNWPYYSRIVYTEDNIYLLPRCGVELLKLEKNSKKIISIPINDRNFQMFKKTRRNWPSYYGYSLYDKKLFIYPCAGSAAIWINCATDDVRTEEITLSSDEYVKTITEKTFCESIKRELEKKGMVKESSEIVTLTRYIQVVKSFY